MAEKTTYTGGCHCGKVRFEADIELSQVFACNCSICSKKAHLLTFVDPDAFRLLSGGDNLTDYQFNKHNIHHTFCATCGVQSFANGTRRSGAPMYAVNARCLDGVDVASLSITNVDGKSF